MRSGFESWALAGILLVAAALRLNGLGAEPWYDEIWTHLRCTSLSFGDLAGTYDSQNHHIFYSLLAKLSLDVFGDSVAALRLPAAAFGLLGILAVYALGCEVASRREGLFAAALLAVAYHHVWFSQNARGYTALAFWCVAATWLLLRALADDSRSLWLLFGVAGGLAAYTHLTALCVVAAHAAIVLQLWLAARTSGEDANGRRVAPGRNALLGFAVLAAVAIALHAPIADQLWQVNTREGREGVVPVWATPAWTAQELAAGLARAFSRALSGGVVVILAAAGLWRLARRRWLVAELFVLPILMSGVLLVASGHHLWPRFFFFAIGLGALTLTSGAFAAGDALARALPRLAGAGETIGIALASLLVVASAASLGGAYEPKQRFREALDLIERDRGAGDTVVALGSAARVYRDYYGKDWPRVATVEEIEAGRGPGRAWLVHTFPVDVRARYPEIQALLDAEFEVVGRFDGTLHEGTVLVWRSKGGPRVADRRRGDGT